MDDQENKHRHDNLEDLLKRAERGQLGDDFEKEAAEGYAMLGNEEARALKSQTDRRVATLFSSRRKGVVQWSIAAGVILLVSMTVYFLRQDVTSDETKVVQTSVSEKEEIVTAPPAPALGPHNQDAAEQKPVSAAQAKPSPPPAESGKSEERSDLQKEAETEVTPKLVPTTTLQPPEVAANNIVSNTSPAPALSFEAPSVMAGNAGAGDKTELSPNSEKAKTRAMKKSAPVPSEARAAADMESRADYDDASPALNKILNAKLKASCHKAFSANVLIKEGLVKDVIFTGGDLSKDDKKAIQKTLRELTAEELRPADLTRGEVKFDYRP